MTHLSTHLVQQRDAGQKLLVPYVMAGAREDWLDVVRAVVDGGADAIEIGIPFSDPVMDGVVIQEAAVRALDRGTTPVSVVEQLQSFDAGIPLAFMTYYNLVFRYGLEEFADACVQAKVSATILPDLPLDEAHAWANVATQHEIDNVMLVAPNTPDARLARICKAARGFVYAVGTLGVTGMRDELAPSATALAGRVKAVTDTPVLIGVGVSNPSQASQAVKSADGVVIGSAVVKRILDGSTPAEIGALVSEFRTAID